MIDRKQRRQSARLLRFADLDELDDALREYVDVVRALELPIDHLSLANADHVRRWVKEQAGWLGLFLLARELGLTRVLASMSVRPKILTDVTRRRSLDYAASVFDRAMERFAIDTSALALLSEEQRPPVSQNEWEAFYGDALEERVALPLERVWSDARRVDMVMDELLLLATRGSDLLHATRAFLGLLRSHRARWLAEVSDAYLKSVKPHVSEGVFAWVTTFMLRRRVLREWFVAADRNDGYRSNAWTKVRSFRVYDEERGIPQLRLQVHIGTAVVFETVDDLDDLVRLGLAITRSALRSAAEQSHDRLPEIIRDEITDQLDAFQIQVADYQRMLATPDEPADEVVDIEQE